MDARAKRRCCDLGGLDFIEVNGRKVGLIGLSQIFADVAALELSDPEKISQALLACAEKQTGSLKRIVQLTPLPFFANIWQNGQE